MGSNQDLKKSFLRPILDSSHEWICICNLVDGSILDFNSSFEKGIRTNGKLLVSKSIFDLDLTIDGKTLSGYLKNIDTKKIIQKKNCDLRVLNKVWKRGDLVISLVRESQSSYFVFSFLDKSTSLKESHASNNNPKSEFKSFINNILENSTDITLIVDRFGKVTYASPSINSVLGYADINNIFTVVAEKEEEKVKSLLTETSKQSNGTLKAQVQVKHSNGTYRTLGFTARNHKSTHGINGILLNAQDITEILKAKEEFTFALAKEKELNRQKTQFISTVSHDFRTPLTNISLNLQLLERQIKDYQNAGFAKNIERISNATKRLTALLNEVSLISREQSGKLNFNPENYTSNDLIDTIIEQVDYLFQHNVTPEIKKNKPVEVDADLTLLTHITDNLISNAIKFSPYKTPINLFLEIDRKGIFRLIVKDNGIGIPKDEIKFLFDPYFRASNVNNINGNGLGLSIVHRCVELHNGTIKIDSDLYKGTKVTVEIPLMK